MTEGLLRVGGKGEGSQPSPNLHSDCGRTQPLHKIRPGKPTADYLKKTSDRLTLFGAIFLALLALIPSLILNAILPSASTSGSFSATGMLIVVSVALEFNTALESQIMAKKYKGFLK